MQRPMISKEVIKSSQVMEPRIITQLQEHPHKELSTSVGTHNLTELRRKLEERMLLTVHDENRTTTKNNERWQSFNSTPDENDSNACNQSHQHNS